MNVSWLLLLHSQDDLPLFLVNEMIDEDEIMFRLFPFLIVVLRVGLPHPTIGNIPKSQACIISHNIEKDLKCLQIISLFPLYFVPCMYYLLGLEHPMIYCVKLKEHQ